MNYAHFNVKGKTKKTVSKAGAISIVNSTKNGKRISISAEVLEKIGFDWASPQYVEIIPYETGEGEAIAIGIFPVFGDGGMPFCLKKQGAKGIIYSAALVLAIIEHLKLEYPEGAVCITLTKMKLKKRGDVRFAVIWKAEEVEAERQSEKEEKNEQ